MKYFTPDQTDIDTIDAPEQRELNRAKAWNALVKATKSYGRFLLQSHIQTRDPAAAWTSIVKHYEPPPPKPSSFWSQMWTTIMLVLYTIYQLLPLFFVVLSEFLLICVMIVRVLADALRSVSDVLHSQWGPLLVLVLLIGGCVLLAMLEPIFMNQ